MIPRGDQGRLRGIASIVHENASSPQASARLASVACGVCTTLGLGSRVHLPRLPGVPLLAYGGAHRHTSYGVVTELVAVGGLALRVYRPLVRILVSPLGAFWDLGVVLGWW